MADLKAETLSNVLGLKMISRRTLVRGPQNDYGYIEEAL